MTVPDRTALLFVALASAVSCAGLIILLRPLLWRYALARPNVRSSHTAPTPQGAGIAVIASTLALGTVAANIMNLAVPLELLTATIFVAIVGFADDLRPIPVLPRLMLQAAAVAVVILAAPAELRIAPVMPFAVERGLLLLSGLWFVNLVNFMDGLDLMTVAEVVPITGALVVVSLLNGFPHGLTAIVASLGGAMLGFAPFNRPVAKVFLGDVGSLPIGLLLGYGLLQLAGEHHLAAALLLPLYYLGDATLTLLLRILRGEPFWAAHRSHFYQRATRNGFSVTGVVAEVFAVNIVLAGLAIASVEAGSVGFRMLLLAIGVILVGLLLYRFSGGKAR